MPADGRSTCRNELWTVRCEETALGPSLVVDGRVDVGLRPDLAQLQEDALGSAHVEQEVVHQRDACPGSGVGRTPHARSLNTALLVTVHRVGPRGG